MIPEFGLTVLERSNDPGEFRLLVLKLGGKFNEVSFLQLVQFGGIHLGEVGG